MDSAVEGQGKKYISDHIRESFEHLLLINDNQEVDADSIFVKALLVMGAVEMICVCNSSIWK